MSKFKIGDRVQNKCGTKFGNVVNTPKLFSDDDWATEDATVWVQWDRDPSDSSFDDPLWSDVDDINHISNVEEANTVIPSDIKDDIKKVIVVLERMSALGIMAMHNGNPVWVFPIWPEKDSEAIESLRKIIS